MITKTIGPMFSKKSLSLITACISLTGTLCVKPAAFDRDGALIKSRASRLDIPCVLIGSGIGHYFNNVDNLFVDEAQGFSLPELRYLSRIASNVHFYGLNYWADGRETTINQLETDVTQELTVNCKCGGVANRTKLISGDNPITAEYEAVCKECFR